jgi:hypothetical protein
MFVALEAALSFTIIIKIYLPHFWIVAALRDRTNFPVAVFFLSLFSVVFFFTQE